MGKRRAAAELRRDAEFEAFTAGAAGRLLHCALLLTGDRAAAEDLLVAALARTYADWHRVRTEDPYDSTRGDIVRRFAHRPWWRRPDGGPLALLTAQERLMVTLRLFEGVAEEQVAALLGLPAERVRAVCAQATATLRSAPSASASSEPGPPGAERRTRVGPPGPPAHGMSP